tara:strand:- start:482 stop:781 length:300 start_codon:yes stop_codon:yes gene_type:complete
MARLEWIGILQGSGPWPVIAVHSHMAATYSTKSTMNSLIQTLQQFADCYEGDPRGLASDFELLAGISMNELTQTLSDEIEKFKDFEREELKQEYLSGTE